jgi:hypothetical protein
MCMRSPRCLCVCRDIPFIAARQRLCKHVPAAKKNRIVGGTVFYAAIVV